MSCSSRETRWARFWGRVPRWVVPLTLYLATWASTFYVGVAFYGGGSLLQGAYFAVPLMTILTLHETGHYLQGRRYRMRTSYPTFIPFPCPPLGTFGAIIRISSPFEDRRALFDLGVSGPLAGLASTLVFLAVGVSCSEVVATPETSDASGLVFGEPLVFQWFARLILNYDPAAQTLLMHPTAVAAWVGVLLTTLNLLPLGQLDGGHVLYALLRRRAVVVSRALFFAALALALWFRLWNWLLLLALVLLCKLRHPATCDDARPLGLCRALVGWATLAFLAVGFTPRPLEYVEASTDTPPSVERMETPRVD